MKGKLSKGIDFDRDAFLRERTQWHSKCVIVSQRGIGASQLVAAKLEKGIPGLEIVAIIPVHRVDQLEIEDFDLIISTLEDLTYKENPIVCVDVFVSKEDIQRVKDLIVNLVEH